MVRRAAVLQAIGVTALIATGLFGVIVNRWIGVQNDLVYLPLLVGLAVGLSALVVYFWRKRTASISDRTPAWAWPGLAIFYLGVIVVTCGVGLFVNAFGRHSSLPAHEGLLGFWMATFGLGVVMLGRFVGRGSL